MKAKLLLTFALLLTAVTGAWAQEDKWNGGTYTATSNETIEGYIYVENDATLTISDGVTVTVTQGITISEGKTLTVVGPGTLVVNGRDGSGGWGEFGGHAVEGDIIIQNANVIATGGTGGEGDNSGNTGGDGGAAFYGSVTILSGSVTATGGQGGQGGTGADGVEEYDNGGDGGYGGYGGDAFAGTLTYYAGYVKATGGEGGEGGYGGEGGSQGGQGAPGGSGSEGSAFKNNVTFMTTEYVMTDEIGNGIIYVSNNQIVEITSNPTIISSGNCGATGHESDVSWTLTGTSPNYTLTISGSGAMANYSGQDMPWLAYKDDITTVVIEAGVTSIGHNAFYSFTKLESVTILASVTQIGDAAFYGCTNLATVSGASGVTKARKSTIFYGTAWLNNLPDGLTYVGHVAYRFKGEGTSVELSDGTTQIADIAFQNSQITSISIPASVTFIGISAFRNSVLTSVTIPASVTYIDDYAFASSALQKIYSLATSAPTLVNNAFQGCHDLTDVIVPATAYSNYNISWFGNSSQGKLKPGYTVTCDEGITTTAGPLVVEGETVTLAYSGTVPDGHTFVYTVKDADENDVTATVLSGTTLTMPGYNITVTGTTEICTPSEIEITSANFTDYFDYDGDFEYSANATPTTGLAGGGIATKGGYFLKATVAAESTLDFKGDFIPDASGNYNPRIFINKRVNITSSDKDAVFKPYISNDETVKLYWNFGILEGADYTEVKNLQFQNCWVFNHGSSYVTFDGIDMKVEDVRIGSGVGALSIRTIQSGGHASDHTTVMNSVFYCRDNGGNSCISAACGAPYVTFHNNTITLEGNVGNGINVNTFNSDGNAPAPEYGTFTNNVITNEGPAKAICYCIIPCGQGNLIENNTINYAGNAINIPYFSSVSEEQKKNIYRNNTTTLGGSISVYEYSVVENNQVSGQLSVAKGATATGNTVAGMTVSQDATVKSNTVNGLTTISGTNVTFQGNTVNGNTTISKTTASFTDNAINGMLTLNSASSGANDNNTITGNVILSTGQHAIELKSSDNTVSGNILISADYEGDAAVKTTKTNTIADNTLAAYESATASSHSNTPYIITSETTAIKAGDNAGTFYYVPTDATVTINGDLAITPNEGATSPKVNILLGDGSKLTVGVIDCDCSLAIYGSSLDDGTLNATATATSGFGIKADGYIIINGGIINATGNDEYGIYGIDGVTINGGTVNATGILSDGNVAINGGKVTSTSDLGISSNSGTITLNWTNSTDQITASSYSASTISIADGKAFTDGTNVYTSATPSASLTALENVTLQPVTGVTLTKDGSGSLTAEFDGTSLTTLSIPGDVTVNAINFGREFTEGVPVTLMLPFSLADGQTFTGGTLYKFSGISKNETTGIWEATMTESATLHANTPYLMMPNNDLNSSGKVTIGLNSAPVKLNTTTAGESSVTADVSADWEFKGSYEERHWYDGTDGVHAASHADEIGKVYGFAATSGKATDGVTDIEAGQFVRFASGAWIRPTRCYLIYKGEDNPMAGARNKRAPVAEELPDKITVRLIGLDGITTKIGTFDTRTGEVTFGDEWYSLDGTKLSGKPNTKGVYINNGKKVAIK